MPISTIGQNGLQQSRILTAVQQPAGAVLQVVSGIYNTNVNISTTTWTSTGVSASITPTSSSSKVLIFISNPMRRGGASGAYGGMYVAIYRGATNVCTQMSNLGYTYPSTNFAQSWLVNLSYLDSPATTSSTTYTMYFRNNSADGSSMSSCVDGDTATITLMEIAA